MDESNYQKLFEIMYSSLLNSTEYIEQHHRINISKVLRLMADHIAEGLPRSRATGAIIKFLGLDNNLIIDINTLKTNQYDKCVYLQIPSNGSISPKPPHFHRKTTFVVVHGINKKDETFFEILKKMGNRPILISMIQTIAQFHRTLYVSTDELQTPTTPESAHRICQSLETPEYVSNSTSGNGEIQVLIIKSKDNDNNDIDAEDVDIELNDADTKTNDTDAVPFTCALNLSDLAENVFTKLLSLNVSDEMRLRVVKVSPTKDRVTIDDVLQSLNEEMLNDDDDQKINSLD